MIYKLKILFSDEKQAYNENKLKYFMSRIILVLLCLISFTLPVLSSSALHNIPLFLTAGLSVLILTFLFMYQSIFVDRKILAIVAFLFIVLLSSILNGTIKQITRTEFLLSIMFITFYEFISIDEFKNKSIFAVYIGLFLFLIIFLAVYFKEIISLDVERLGGIFGNQNGIAQYLCFGYILNLHFAFNKKYYLLLLPLPLFAILSALTGSKQVILIILLSTIAFIIMFFGKKRWYWSLILIIVGVLFVFGTLQLKIFSTLRHRIIAMCQQLFNKGSNNSLDMSTIERYNMFFEGLYLFQFKPLFGWGANAFRYIGAYGVYSHSTISELLCNYGLFGFICFILPVLFSAFSTDSKNNDYKLKTMLIIYVIVLYFISVAINSKVYYLMLAIICACSCCNKNDSVSNKILYYKK